MAGSTLRRTVLCLVVVGLLLPLASAWAAPTPRSEALRIQLPDWSRILLGPLDGLLGLFRPAFEPSHTQPGPNPGNPISNEGNGFDPHGGKP